MSTGGLTVEQFRLIADRGAVDPHNAYAHSMTWWRDRLYIGTFRSPLCLLKQTNRRIPPPKMAFWPVQCADPEDPEVFRGQIIYYDPARDAWKVVQQAPVVDVGGDIIARDLGYRGMVAYRGRSDPHPCIYAGSISRTGAHIMRCEDGERFEVTHLMPGPSIRTLVTFKDKLFTSIVGELRKHGNESAYREVYESVDPVRGEWYPVSEPGFGDEGNVSLFEMCEFNDHLYVGTMNPFGGFHIYKSRCEGPAPYHWDRIMTAGAYRGFLNEFAISMCVFNGCLYVGSGIAGGGYDRVRKVGPAAAELLRIYPDDSWDLIVGAPRLTPEGLKVPLSGLGAGFDNFLNGYTWRICEHQGYLYVSTFNASCFIKYRPHGLTDLAPEQIEQIGSLLPTGDLDRFTSEYGGGHLWRSADGVRFTPVMRNGFGTPHNYGIRQMVSTPLGLFAGTANPFGPMIGVNRDGQWSYEANPRGGMEVWLGSSDVRQEPPPRLVPELRSRDREHRHAMLRATRQIEQIVHVTVLNELYDKSSFSHLGYWKDGPASARVACEQLVDALVARLPDRAGPVLEAGCIRGGTTQRLLAHFDAAQLTAIDDSPWAADTARHVAPGVRLSAMDPARLEFADASFAAVFCFEGAATFDTRQAFLSEAARVLRPGGWLLMADVLFSREAVIANRGRYRTNYVKDLAAYRNLLVKAGFEPDPRIDDVTSDTVAPFLAHVSAYLTARFRDGQISEGQYNTAMALATRQALFVRNYLLVAARRRG